ncbi:HDOD domain-containing protein [Horticoccus sp. 23ND18S-11]|uniref:HDOD domain-containing protein n=1 Tax=Horticoccus sp. 23ND18S-11 TaxID=3391832 RepID=UPI0039C90B75
MISPTRLSAEALVQGARTLQAPSATVVRLLTLLDQPEADYDEVIAVVSRDVVLSAKLLAVCNSAMYGLARPVASLDHGVLYLGFGEIHRLVMALSFGGSIGVELPGYDMAAGTLWQHAIVTALLTPRVAAVATSTGADTSIAYTAGLLHDIGKLVIGQAISADARHALHERVRLGGLTLIDAEKEVIGCDHAEVGATLLRKWRLPEIIVEAVAAHHRLPATGGASLAAVVHVADALAHQSGASPGWESFAVMHDASAVTTLGLSDATLERLALTALECRDEVARQQSASGVRPRSPAPATAVVAGAAF